MGILEQSQIHSIFISLIIGDVQYGCVDIPGVKGNPPQMITSLQVEKVSSGREFVANGYTFTIKLNYLMVPDFYERILKLMKSSSDGLIDASIQYGYYSDYDSWGECSPLYNLKLLSCQPDDLWSTLTLKFIQVDSKNSYNTFTAKTIAALDNNYYDNLSDYVKAIAVGQGWKIGQIEPTIPYEGEIKRDSSIESPIQCINELLSRYPNESVKGGGRYVSLFKHTLNESTFHFIPTTFAQSNYLSSDTTYEFFFNALPQGKVISFNPKFVSNIVDEASQEANSLDPSKLLFEERPDLAVITTDTREIKSIEYNMNDVPVGNNSVVEPESYAGFMNPAHLQININSQNLKNYIRSSIKENISRYVNVIGVRTSAEMEILGDPSLNVGDYILVIPMYLQDSYDKPGKIHPSGGTYQIMKITDTINGGNFTTNLQLRAVAERDFKVGEITTDTMNLEYIQNKLNKHKIQITVTDATGDEEDVIEIE